MKKLVIFIFCAALFIVGGCAEVQRPTTQEFHLQQQLQSARHWQTIAKLNAEYLIKTLVDGGFIEKDTTTPAIYISEADQSPFGLALRGYLLTELMNLKSTTYPKLEISDNSDSPIILSWNTQLVNRNTTRLKPFLGIPVCIGEFVATLVMGGGWNTSDVTVPHTELILTTNIKIGKTRLARYSETYFINDEDWTNYRQNITAYLHPQSIAAKDGAWKRKLVQKGLLAQ